MNCGNQLAAVGEVALPVLYFGCTSPAIDGGTAAAATAGPTSGPTGTVPIGGGVGGGNVGTPDGLPIVGGGTMTSKAGKKTPVPAGTPVNDIVVTPYGGAAMAGATLMTAVLPTI